MFGLFLLLGFEKCIMKLKDFISRKVNKYTKTYGSDFVLGTIVNSLAIIIGSIIGIIFRKGISEKYKSIIMQGLPLCILIIGVSSALKTKNIMILILSIVFGSIIGEWLNIEKKLENMGILLSSKFNSNNGKFTEGFITASLLFCVGAMAIMGALESGLTGKHDTLFAKSILDGITAIIFSSTMGIGVMFSAIAVFIYQGAITMSASVLSQFISEAMVNEMSAIGGVLIIGLAFNVLGFKKDNIRVGNMLPAIFLPIIYFVFMK